MKKKMLVLGVGLLFMATSCSVDESKNDESKNDKTEFNTSDIQDSDQFKAFEDLYFQFINGKIENKDFLFSTTSVNIAKDFLSKLGETNYGGYTNPEDIVSFALIQYLQIISN